MRGSVKEIDYFCEKLSAGGPEQLGGSLKAKFGLSWQIVPPILGEMMSDPDLTKSQRVMKAMFQMVKIDINKLKRAYAVEQAS